MASLQKRWPDELPTSAKVERVPFYPQEDYHCGPASMAMAASGAGVNLQPEDVLDKVYLPARKGSLQVEMFAAGRHFGLLSYRLKPNMKALLQEVAAGNPVIVLQNLSFPISPVWHYAVVTGFDRERNTLTLHSGRTRDMEMSLYAFERTWERADHWAILVLPPTKIPATADVASYASAVMAMELVAPAAAHSAYMTGLRKWPGHPTLLLGAGNTAYALGRLDVALYAYREMTRQYPANADGWNNMAQTLLDMGKLDEAGMAIERAVTLGGERLPRYLELRKEIHAKH
ncbi:PA2778 family cysteine peptidase [Paucimonas lemoignei]|nr:PA2778 family cysteine peptidase [Paucimonas lemoignei]